MSPETLPEKNTIVAPANAPWKPGQSGNPAGKPPGPNKATRLLREAVLNAAVLSGNRIAQRELRELREKHGDIMPPGVEIIDADGLERYLIWLSEAEPKSFASLLARILPLQLEGRVEVKSDLGDLLQQINGNTRSK